MVPTATTTARASSTPVPRMTIGDARDKFSSLVADIATGAVPECIIMNRRKPVAKIVPFEAERKPKRVFGIAKDSPFLADEAAFDALDAEIADEFGV